MSQIDKYRLDNLVREPWRSHFVPHSMICDQSVEPPPCSLPCPIYSHRLLNSSPFFPTCQDIMPDGVTLLKMSHLLQLAGYHLTYTVRGAFSQRFYPAQLRASYRLLPNKTPTVPAPNFGEGGTFPPRSPSLSLSCSPQPLTNYPQLLHRVTGLH